MNQSRSAIARRQRRLLLWIIGGLVLLALVTTALLVAISNFVSVPPRLLAPYIERRTTGHNPIVEQTGRRFGKILTALDRPPEKSAELPPLRIGAQALPPLPTQIAGNTSVIVASSDEGRAAINRAEAGTVITFLPGTYRFSGASIAARRAGTPGLPITVRAIRPGTVTLEFDIVEGFHVSAPYWSFQNLTIRGVCRNHSSCEHAFHVVGKGSHFSARNNTIIDFNAHFKINGSDGQFPDRGIIEGNTLTNSGVRRTGNPVAVIDLVAASHWVVRNNLITDFAKAESDQISYGGFAKGAGTDNRFETNLILCEHLLQGIRGRRVGLSLGGGGTSPEVCRDRRCVVEQENSVLQANFIAFCSDDGIYLNRAATSRIVDNTLIDTAGIQVRFPQSSAELQGNLADGVFRSRDGGVLHDIDNYATSLTRLYLGSHPIRGLFVDAMGLDLAWRANAPRRTLPTTASLDLCGGQRALAPAYGAFDNFSQCLDLTAKPISGSKEAMSSTPNNPGVIVGSPARHQSAPGR